MDTLPLRLVHIQGLLFIFLEHSLATDVATCQTPGLGRFPAKKTSDASLLQRLTFEGSVNRTRPKTTIELTFVGDIIFGRYRKAGNYIQHQQPESQKDPNFQPFAKVSRQLSSDVVIGNLETPLRRTLPSHIDSPPFLPLCVDCRFGGSAAMAELLVGGNFSVVSLANNHAWDMLSLGCLDTPAILEEVSVIPVGASKQASPHSPTYPIMSLESHGLRIGFISVTMVRNFAQVEGAPELPFIDDADALSSPIIAARDSHDVIIVLIHWGTQFVDEPSPAQKNAGKRLIDLGVNMVIGCHSHTLQGIERYKHGLIAYSLGNFLWDDGGKRCRDHTDPCTDNFQWNATGILRVGVSLEDHHIERVVFHPAFQATDPVYHPQPAMGELGDAVRKRMQRVSGLLNTTLQEVNDGDLVMAGW